MPLSVVKTAKFGVVDAGTLKAASVDERRRKVARKRPRQYVDDVDPNARELSLIHI